MVYKWYILPIGGLYAAYHLLGEPETTIDYRIIIFLARDAYKPSFATEGGVDPIDTKL